MSQKKYINVYWGNMFIFSDFLLLNRDYKINLSSELIFVSYMVTLSA